MTQGPCPSQHGSPVAMVIGLGLSMWLWLNNQALLQLALGPLSQKLEVGPTIS